VRGRAASDVRGRTASDVGGRTGSDVCGRTGSDVRGPTVSARRGTGVTATWPDAGAVPAGLVMVARAEWPEPGDATAPPAIPGFVGSTFSPIVAALAQRCLGRAAVVGRRTAVVVVTACGDVASAVQVAAAVDAGARIAPLLFFQSVPNAVAGHIAARHGLDGPVVCLSPMSATPGGALAEGLAEAVLLIGDADADGALVVVADQEPDVGHAVLVGSLTEAASGLSGAPA
jgi:hypothetical protein